MQQSILLGTLQALASEELELLEDFIKSPLFHKGTHANQTKALFSFLKKAIHEGIATTLQKEEVAQALYGHATDTSKVKYLENHMSNLMSVIRKFITWQEVKKRWGSSFEDLCCARFYRQRGLGDYWEGSLRKSKQMSDKDALPKDTQLILRYWIEEEFFELENFRNERKGDLNIPATLNALSVFHATKLLKVALSQRQQERVVVGFQTKKKEFIQKMRRLFQEQDHFDHPTILMLDQALLLMEDDTEDPQQTIAAFVDLIALYASCIHLSVIKNLASYARNYCTAKINQGYRGLRQLRIQLYKDHLEKGWIFAEGKIIPSSFINILNIGLWADEKQWVLSVLHNYRQQLSGSDEEKTIQYGFALYHLHCEQIKDARAHLNQLLQMKKFKDMKLQRLVRVLEIKLLYEEEDSFIHNQLQNFLMFIRRNEHIFDEASREMHIKFKKVVSKICRFRTQLALQEVSAEKCSKTIQAIEKQLTTPKDPIIERLWLLKKLEQIKEN